MDNTTMTMNAVSCVLSVRLRPTTGLVRLAATLAPEQGTTVSVAAFMGGRVADFRAPVQGDVSVTGPHVRPPTHKIPDVVRSRPGGPRSDQTQAGHLQAAEPDITGIRGLRVFRAGTPADAAHMHEPTPPDDTRPGA